MIDWIALAGLCLVSSGLAVLWLAPRQRRRNTAYGLLSPATLHNSVFLFAGHDLVTHSDIALAGHENIHDWAGLRRLLQRNFPAFPESPEDVCAAGTIVVPAIDSACKQDVLCEWIDGIVRVQIRDLSDRDDSHRGQRNSNDPLRLMMDKAPYPVWLVDHDSSVRWCNATYVSLARKIRGKDTDLTAPMFPDVGEDMQPEKKYRFSLTADDTGRKLWFDLSIVRHDEGILCYAVDINAIVEAEVAQRKFVQTLAKTFAQLSIGLAIFDRNRQLALFNPALIDLTSLPADFLSCRPKISSFFDRLRNQNMMPEPKNYGGWRKQMNDLLEAAADGSFQETWSLPSGSVYCVSGRPHPDGAVAFLFEDITAEITLTRQFRAELELVQAIFDKLADAIAVFSPDGSLAFSNSAYHRLWDIEQDVGLTQPDVLDATRIWQDQCLATPVWGEIRDFARESDNRAEWSACVSLRNGTPVSCTVSPIQNGATIVRFAVTAEKPNMPLLEQA